MISLNILVEKAGSKDIEITGNVAKLFGYVSLEFVAVSGEVKAQVAEVDLFLAENQIIVPRRGIG